LIAGVVTQVIGAVVDVQVTILISWCMTTSYYMLHTGTSLILFIFNYLVRWSFTTHFECLRGHSRSRYSI